MPFSLRYPALFALGFIGGCFVVASSFPVPSEYPAGNPSKMEEMAGYFRGKEDGIFDGKHYFCG